MAKSGFFEQPTGHSRAKAAIVSKYFEAWARVIVGTLRTPDRRIAYVDLLAGPGAYADGTRSTPLLVLQRAVAKPSIAQRLQAVFNDSDPAKVDALRRAISELPGIERLKYQPEFYHREVLPESIEELVRFKDTPGLFFVDPWGYKAVSLDLIMATVRDWACECIFFFNYNRVNAAVDNPAVHSHMVSIFGRQRLEQLRRDVQDLSPFDREQTIIRGLEAALDPEKTRYVLPFRFLDAHGTRPSHYLVHVSKNFKGYNIMKGVMAGLSSHHDQGVASFEYSPLPFLPLDRASLLDALEVMLLDDFAGTTITFKELFESHSVGTPYTDTNYKKALRSLEERGTISAEKPGKTRRKGTFPDDVRIAFRRKGD